MFSKLEIVILAVMMASTATCTSCAAAMVYALFNHSISSPHDPVAVLCGVLTVIIAVSFASACTCMWALLEEKFKSPSLHDSR